MLTFAEYKDRLAGCWLGKNIGGVLGAPFEGKRGMHQVSFYTQDLSKGPPPNDDLDLQLVFLCAVEKYGRHIDASLLGEYWLSFIIPDWVEYGAGKNNLRMGLVPPLSGHVNNVYKDSCGCFIRSELWACLAPGLPEIAARYAYEDAIVDHASEGVHGEVFCAALQSAAFVEQDTRRLLDIGLSYIPKDCGVARAVREAIACYEARLSVPEARRRVLSREPGTFGVQSTKLCDIEPGIPVGKPGYDAPGNIGLVVLGWLYGEGDFGKSLCTAVNCGEDTDCTAATLGALMGILLGAGGIPESWSAPLNDAITTCCVNRLNGVLDIPDSCTQLTDRVLRLTPLFLGREHCDLLAEGGYTIKTADRLAAQVEDEYLPFINGGGKPRMPDILTLQQQSPYQVFYSFPAFHVKLDYQGEPFIRCGELRRLKLTVWDNGAFGALQQWIRVKWHAPEGVQVLPGPQLSFFMENTFKSEKVMEFSLLIEEAKTDKVELILEVSSNARHSTGLVKVVLIPDL